MNTTQEPSQVTAETKKQELSPKPSYGVFVWAGFLALGTFSGPHIFPIQVLCFLLSLGACIWWFLFSRTHRLSNLLRRIIGCIAFAFGSMMPLSAALIVLLGQAHKDSPIHTAFLFILCLAVGAGLIAGGFYMTFRRGANVAA